MIAEWRTAVAGADMADWVTVAAYLITAALAARAAGIAWMRREGSERLFWRVAAILLLFLGINELLDLQALLTAVGKNYAKAGGWYEQRRGVQFVFIIALAASSVVLGMATIWLARRMHRSIWLALMGLGFIGLFILLRAASFHHLDQWLGGGMPRFNYGSIQEMAGILIVAAGAVLYGRARRRKPRQRLPRP